MEPVKWLTRYAVAKVVDAALAMYNLGIGKPDGRCVDVAWMEENENYHNLCFSATLNGIDFLLHNPTATAKDIHNNWVKFLIDNNWTFGAEKDIMLKTHPLMIPFEDMTLEDKIKDKLFLSVVVPLLPLIDTTERGV